MRGKIGNESRLEIVFSQFQVNLRLFACKTLTLILYLKGKTSNSRCEKHMKCVNIEMCLYLK